MKKSGKELLSLLNDARTKIDVGGIYQHYKDASHHYVVDDLVINEADDEVYVIYEGLYEELQGIKFSRPLESFLEEVELEGKNVQRFSLVE